MIRMVLKFEQLMPSSKISVFAIMKQNHQKLIVDSKFKC
jgi:hypothetical protein